MTVISVEKWILPYIACAWSEPINLHSIQSVFGIRECCSKVCSKMSFIIKGAYIIVLVIYLFIAVYLLVIASSSSTPADDIAKPAHWKFDTPKNYAESSLREWRAPKQHQGTMRNADDNNPLVGINSSNPLMHKLMREHGYNWLATELVSLHRSLPDYRCAECRTLVYPNKLPTASIVIIFHNEAWSLLLRTIWSILDRSPAELIEEIILVDDVSTWAELQRPIEDYIELLPVPVLLIRTKKREGLIRARLIGADVARVLFFIIQNN